MNSPCSKWMELHLPSFVKKKSAAEEKKVLELPFKCHFVNSDWQIFEKLFMVILFTLWVFTRYEYLLRWTREEIFFIFGFSFVSMRNFLINNFVAFIKGIGFNFKIKLIFLIKLNLNYGEIYIVKKRYRFAK